MRLKILVFFLFLPMNLLSAHIGGTDGKGGHHDRKNGGYHFHHGNPAHQHTNGQCPYNDKVNHSKRNNISGNSNRTDNSGWYVAGAILLTFSGYNLYQRNQGTKIKNR